MTDATIAEPIKGFLESLRRPELVPFLEDWPRTYLSRSVPAASLPVLRWLPKICDECTAFADLVADVCRAAPSMAWRQTYSTPEADAAFLDNYGWSEILGENAPIAAGGRIACGLLLLGPSTHYPRHSHQAEEIYLPLHGTAAWQQGDAVWRDRTPGTLIHHASEEPHAMRTGAAPMLALYLWRGDGLAHKARFENAIRDF